MILSERRLVCWALLRHGIGLGISVFRAALAGALLVGSAVSAAQTFPIRPVRVVVPYPPGGPNDIVARIAAQRLPEIWQQTVVVDNRSGAGGNIGMELVAKSPPDGYTV